MARRSSEESRDSIRNVCFIVGAHGAVAFQPAVRVVKKVILDAGHGLAFRGAAGRRSAVVIGFDVGGGLFGQHVAFRDGDHVADFTANSRGKSCPAPAERHQEHERQHAPCELFH